MLIKRMQVEEGFLDGLDVAFGPGLNVLIGARGSGKTSLIELLRFCIGVEPLSSSLARAATDHALAVLGSGRVTVTVDLGADQIVVTRAARSRPSVSLSTETYQPPLVLGQNEIEAIGLDAGSRLRLLDAFLPLAGARAMEQQQLSLLSSLSVQVRTIASEVSALQEQIARIGDPTEDLKAAEAEQTSLLQDADAVANRLNSRLAALATDTSTRTVAIQELTRSLGSLDRWAKDLERVLAGAPSLPELSLARMQRLKREFADSIDQLNSALLGIRQIYDALAAESEAQSREYTKADDEARDLRRRIDASRSGAGAASKKVSDLQERAAQAKAAQGALLTQMEDLRLTQELRATAFETVDDLRRERSERRLALAATLNREFAPRIRVDLEKSGHMPEYVSALANVLRGSGLHYNELAATLAPRLSPRELVELVEVGDAPRLSHLAGISLDRASRAVQQMREAGLQDVLLADIEDRVDFRLLDGDVYKGTDELSTGQRCTVLLPLLLRQHARVVVLDQPEDHLDNAFIVETVIRAVQARPPESQLIVATHNANLPVLGEAASVFELQSDGHRGFIADRGPLTKPSIVEAITTLMEGGRRAFELRAQFYADHLGYLGPD
jgi:predicted  nucleic acid-binding Zn-ribbon protein